MKKEAWLAVNNDGDNESWDGNFVLIVGLLWAIIALGGYYITLRIIF